MVNSDFFFKLKISVTVISLIIVGFLVIRQEIIDQNERAEISKEEQNGSYVPHFDHIVLLVMENRSYEEIVENPKAPYENTLIQENALAANYFAITHPSLPNYLALLGGSTFSIKTDCTNCLIQKTNLIDQLDHAHKTWKAYFESIPKTCYLGSHNLYTRKYNSFVYFADIIHNKTRCDNIVPYTQLFKDMKDPKTTPDFVWISPNLCHDTHYCKVGSGDKWLSTNIPKILSTPAFQTQNSLLIITWDEAERHGSNHIATIFIGKNVKKEFVSHKYYTHYSLLHTIEQSWNIKPITKKTQKAHIMSDFFKEPTLQ